MLIDYGVNPRNIFSHPKEKPTEAFKACRKGDVLVVAVESVIGNRYYGSMFTILDDRGASLYSIASDTTYDCANGKTFGAFKAIMDKAQTAAARASQSKNSRAPVEDKLTASELLEVEKAILKDESIHSIARRFGVAPNYFSRKGITRDGVLKKYDRM